MLIKELKSIYNNPEFKDDDISSLLSIILGKGRSTSKSKDITNKLLSEYKNNLKALSRAALTDLSNIIGKNNANLLLTSQEFFRQTSLYTESKITINSPEDVASLLFNEMRYYQKEVFKVILLNTKNQVIKIETVSVGILDASLVHPREIFHSAIREMASSLILAHNHPSSVNTPSSQDLEITKNIVAAGEILNLAVVDHIIISESGWLSLKEKKYI